MGRTGLSWFPVQAVNAMVAKTVAIRNLILFMMFCYFKMYFLLFLMYRPLVGASTR